MGGSDQDKDLKSSEKEGKTALKKSLGPHFRSQNGPSKNWIGKTEVE